jgi:F420H(2)-dependent quinone reductase
MRIVKSIAIVALVYVALVTAFESMIGTLQPQTEGSTLVLTTLGDDGSAHDRVVSKLESGGQLYVAVNHWPRAWYGRLLANPQVRVTLGGTTGDYTAVPVDAGGEEHERVASANPVPGWFRFVTGFAPRYFVRLEPRV